MNKTPFEQPSNSEDELLPEYRFDYEKAKPNRFANRRGKPRLTVVVLDEAVAEVFSTPESVNKVLRALIEMKMVLVLAQGISKDIKNLMTRAFQSPNFAQLL